MTTFTSSDGTASYSYDPTNQLTAANYTTSSGGHQPANESYSYTANGNRNSTGSDNLMSSDGTYNYQYDADGNRTVRTQIASTYSTDYRTTYTWDYRNRLTDVDNYDNNSVLEKHVHFVYDIFNTLIGEEDDDTGSGSYDREQWYVNEGGQPILQFDGSGNLTVRYLARAAQEEVTSLTQAGTVYWVAEDNEGSVRDVVDNNGHPVDHIVYSAFGQIAYESAPTTPHWAGYAGEHLSAATSLVISGARWYDAGTGKWLSQDPIGFRGRDADLSRYVGNDPTNATDPTGMLATSIKWSTQGDTLTESMLGTDGGSTPFVKQYTTLLDGMTAPMQAAGTWAGTAPQPESQGFWNNLIDANADFYSGFVGGLVMEDQLAIGPFVNTNSAPYSWGQGASGWWWLAFMYALSQSGCFTAGTQVLVPGGGDGRFASGAVDVSLSNAGRQQASWPLLIAVIGAAGFVTSQRKSRDEEDEEQERALRVLFGEDVDTLKDEGPDPMNPNDERDYQRRIDALCEALFNGEDIAATAFTEAAPALQTTPARGAAVRKSEQGRAPLSVATPHAIVGRRPERRRRAARGRSRKLSGYIWLATCLLLAAWLGLRPPAVPNRARSPAPTAASSAMPTYASRAIETIRVGERVLGENPDLAQWQHNTRTAVDPPNWRLLKLHAEQRWDDGTLDTIEVETLQPPDWLKEHRALRGAIVPLPLNLTEMGLPEDLRAKVMAIEPCPRIADGPGHVVTSTVSHLNRFLFDLEIVNGRRRTEKITTTGYHKFYSTTRSGWVSACELRPAEQLRGVAGPLTVAGVQRLPGVERVYNFSVEGEHVYHVSALGALVHNPGCWGGPEGFSNPEFGNEVHKGFEGALTSQTGTNPGDWSMATGPGQTGVDATWTGGAGGINPGFNYAELKPYTDAGMVEFENQMWNWELWGQGQTQLWFYNEGGVIGSSGINY